MFTAYQRFAKLIFDQSGGGAGHDQFEFIRMMVHQQLDGLGQVVDILHLIDEDKGTAIPGFTMITQILPDFTGALPEDGLRLGILDIEVERSLIVQIPHQLP